MSQSNNSKFMQKIIFVLMYIITTMYVLMFVYILLDFFGISNEQNIPKIFTKTSKTVIKPENQELKKENNIDNIIEVYDKNEVSSNTFLYYDQLDEYSKIIYEEIAKNLDKMKSGTYIIDFEKKFNNLLNEQHGEERLKDSFNFAINAISLDKPEVFYIDISKVCLFLEKTNNIYKTTYRVKIGPEENETYLNQSFYSEVDVNKAIDIVNSKKDIIKSKLSGTIENQIKMVHDYLVDNIEYDTTMSQNNIYDIYGALVNKKVVCEGYARTFKYLMDNLNIPCVIVYGTGTNGNGKSEKHAWNYVKIDSNWYAIDVTWDDPVILENKKNDDITRYRYYLKGSENFFVDHVEDRKIVTNVLFKYPIISTQNYG